MSKICASGTEENKRQDMNTGKVSAKTASRIIGSLSAAAVPGEVGLVNTFSLEESMVPNVGPFKYLANGLMRIIRGIKSVFKDKKLWIPAFVLAVIWIVLSILSELGINPLPVRILSFLTFAEGGMTGGTLGLAGGLIGKGIYAYFITSLIIPVFTRKKPVAFFKNGLINLKSSFTETFKNPSLLPVMLTGSAIALLLYNFMAGSSTLQNSMPGFCAFLLSIRAIANKTGFLRGFLASWICKFKKGSSNSINTVVNRLIAGLTLGFALSVPLSADGSSYSAYTAGAVILISAVILAIVFKSKKEVAV